MFIKIEIHQKFENQRASRFYLEHTKLGFRQTHSQTNNFFANFDCELSFYLKR